MRIRKFYFFPVLVPFLGPEVDFNFIRKKYAYLDRKFRRVLRTCSVISKFFVCRALFYSPDKKRELNLCHAIVASKGCHDVEVANGTVEVVLFPVHPSVLIFY